MFPKKELAPQNYLPDAITPAQLLNQKNYQVIKIIKSLNDLKNS